MNHLKHLRFFITLALLLPTLMLAGCGSDTAGDPPYVIEEAPGIQITAEALEILLDSGEPHNLTYTVRTS